MLTGFGALMQAAGERISAVDLVLSKPVRLGTLRDAVARALAGVPHDDDE
jgi:hypothetical protein